jgi:hypothetical protein
MTKLTHEQRAFIVGKLAQFATVGEVVRAFKENFGTEITAQLVAHYDVSCRGYNNGRKWKALFDQERATFLDEVARIGISHRTVRLKRLEDLWGRAVAAGNLGLAASFLEQAAKEVGGLYTSRREVEANVSMRYEDKTTEELKQEILQEMMELGLIGPEGTLEAIPQLKLAPPRSTG